ncbi:MAG: rod shape-determining protein MreC [Pyrinomonadaceae bacterium]
MVERSQKEVWRTTPWLMIALLLGSFILMAWSAKTTSEDRVIRVWALALADFVQSPVTTVSSAMTNYFQSFANIRNAASENDELKQKIQQLEVEVQSKEDLAVENERLKTLLNLKEEIKYPALTAKIIGRDPSGWFNDSVINQGSYNGVKLNMPVVANGGLVGRVTAVSPLTAQVTLVTDERFGAGAVVGEIGNSNSLGVVSGMDDRELLEMRYVPGSVDVQVGQSVFTTGQDGLYPEGLKLGEIVEVSGGSATTSKTIYIKPSAQLNSMQEVAVLLYEPPLRQKFEQTLPNAVKTDKTKNKKQIR